MSEPRKAAAVIAHALQPGPITAGLTMKCGLKATKRTSKRHVIAGNAAAATCVACAAVVAAERKLAEYERGPVAPHLAAYYEWAAGPDSGLSSQAIVQVLTGARVLGSWDASHRTPRDPSDFGRCHRMLQRFPELRARLHEISATRPEWTGLVEHWDELTALYEEEAPSGEAPKLYARIQELTR